MLKSFMKYYKPYKWLMLLLIIGSSLRAGLELFFPYVVKQIIEQELPSKDLQQLFYFAAGLLVLYLGQMGLQYLVGYFGFKMSAGMENDMRRDLFQHLQEMSYGFYDKNKSGNLLSRLTNDLADVGELGARGPNDLIVCSISILGTMGIMLWLQPFLGALVIALLLLKLVHTLGMNRKMKQAFYNNKEAMGELTAKAAESINGARLVKAFAMEEADRHEFMDKANDYLTARKASFKLRSYFMGSIIFFSNFINIAIMLVGGVLIHQGSMRFSDLVAFLLYVGMFMKPMMQLMGFVEMYQKGLAGYRRFYEIMQVRPEIKDKDEPQQLENIKGEISFENVTFGYDAARPVIKNLNLTVKPGETVAFVGGTGAGKTTIANLLLRFYEPQNGRITVDGVDIADLQQASLRQRIGLVQQDVFLFSDSVKHNIGYGKHGASDAEIKEAAASAAADDFIAALPEGYETEVGERGVKLSGGQKQRLAIARAFLKNPPILVLDEATSALDNKTEKQIQEKLEQLAVGRTTLIIAHRLSTIRRADKIVVLQNGSVVEMGKHEELLTKKGVYYNLYNAA